MRPVRAFVAIRLSPGILAAIAQVQARLRGGEGGSAARWIAPSSVHLTLKFLGDVPGERLPVVYDAVSRAVETYGPLTLALASVGCFPNLHRPRIVWLGIREPSGQLVGLQAGIESELAIEGFPTEARAFTPHLTIGRAQPSARLPELQALAHAVESYRLERGVEMCATEVHVLQSDLRPSGAVYTELYAAPLHGRPA
ncbi:MAG: RNA 2',3'-cyclic phosphodiesterase [Anaerolineae bacterium]